MRLRRTGIIAGSLALVAVLVGTIPAAAATTTAWATWQPLTGTGGAYTTTVQIAAQPALTATMTSDSRDGQIGVISGASTWLSEGTPIGAKYGSSRDQAYLNLRPKADNATSPSTTTYSFATPTPTSGWAFAVGDIDADAVRIRATAPDGHVLTAAELGLQDLFNYCAPGVVGKPSCTGAADDVPTWDETTLTLTGNAAAADTSGSAAWFEPNAAISSLSLIFTRRSGFPVYQTWFASIAQDITGTVSDTGAPASGVALTLTDANGTVVGTTTTAADGTYSFPGFIAADGYTVRITPPAGKIPTGPTTITANLSAGDAVADFGLRDIVPVAVSGRVTDTTGAPVAGVAVTIDGQTTTTDADGSYLFDQVSVGTHPATITAPSGYTIDLAPPPVVVPAGSEVPIENVDFRIAENPDLRGTVRSNGAGVAGVTVTAVGPGGVTLTRVTDASGAYTFPRLAAGDYTITMTTPAGYIATSPVTRDQQVAAADVEDVDFELARLGAVDGTVRDDDGNPIADVTVTVTGPGAPQQVASGADGTFGLGELPPGTYTLTVVPPTGTSVVGSATRTVVITAAGEAVEGQDFTLAEDAVVVPPDPTDPPSTGGGNGALPATGLGPETLAWAVGGGAVLILGVVLLVVARRRSRG
ncbi:carboxypeptidase regulatory-like domain-containing protein [Microbacterium sp. NPDC028030]|uniref:MSCRAMM family protein n=1 Tax=Microbacterium sp. NPDC028030 TaxID=3155124 RepID=UPI0033F9569C